MGSFYTNITLRGPTRPEVLRAVEGRRAYLSPTREKQTVVYDAVCEEQDPAELEALARRLSLELSCTALAVLNHDDDVLMCWLYQDGVQVDVYNSAPDALEGGEAPPFGGDPEALTEAFAGDPDAVERVLRSRDERFLFALARHRELARALRLPECSIGFGYGYAARGEAPNSLHRAELTEV
ncbi:MAG: hypothetical protein JXX28_12210 [Deltaproteobacteria bacterium]|nr:hypothetical protein [Deltaproteobacteria bacterium]